MQMKKIFLILGLCIASKMLLAQQANPSSGQFEDNPPIDGYAIKSDIQDRRVIPYSRVRTGDVVFSKRIWREMDLNEGTNHVFASPKAKLIDVLMEAVLAGELTAYDPTPTKEDPTGDSFLKRLPADQALGRFVDSVLVPQFDDEGYQVSSTMMAGEFNSDSVTRFRIKEDWFYDRQRSVFEPRIVGIAPLMKINMGGVSLDEQPAFWIYFPEARHILVNKQVADPVNDALGISFDDLFTRRLFSSTIIKESNPQDLRIKDYTQGADELAEAERIQNKLGEYNESIWVDLPEIPEKQKRGLFGIGKKKK
jgi:gliding motility associated protien GldN